MKFPDAIKSFPVFPYLESLCETLKNSSSHTMIVTAETGAGKSTVFPFGLMKNFEGKIIMTQPRKLSVLGTSERIASLMGEQTGQTCGYRIHLESKVSKNTKLEVVTEAVLLRMLQDDFALENFNVVILDEFHERSVNLDLVSSFLKEALSVRENLYVVIMSATIDSKKISAFFNEAPVVQIPGRTYPVEIEYHHDWSVERAVVEEFNKTENGSILVFQSGIYEINKTVSALMEKFSGVADVEILKLHSSVSMEEQKKILEPSPEGIRRIIVSSAIAETSVTVPDVISVIDCGFSRTKIYNAATGMEKLVTQMESDFSANQRSGRAGRTQKGRAIRLWSKNDVRPKEMLPEILRSELSSVVLEFAERGEIRLSHLDLLDKPSENIWNESRCFLEQTLMLNHDGSVTEKGSCALKLGMSLRLAGILLASFGNEILMSYAKTLYEKYGEENGNWQNIIERLKKSGWKNSFFPSDRKMLLLEGYADRVAKKTSDEQNTEYQFVSGRKARLHSSCKLQGEWVVVPELDGGSSLSIIFNGEEIGGKEFEQWISERSEKNTECFFDKGKIIKLEKVCFGKIELASKKLVPSDDDIIPAWKNEVQKKGIEVLPFDERCRKFLLRVEFYRQQKNLDTDLKNELTENFDRWLVPFLSGVKKIEPSLLFDALYWYLDGNDVDKEVPEFLVFSNGRKVKVVYEKNEKIRPVVEVIIQRIFGCFSTPEIMGQKVLLKLLSPASRPLQITEDLENFWTESWPQICKEMKGRYPKHNWDNTKILM